MATGRSRSPPAARDGVEQALREAGEKLRAARLARGEDLEEIAAYLRIKPVYLAALEAGDAASLPGRAYAMGFVRTYADHLALDGRALASSLKPAVTAATRDGDRPRRGPRAGARRPAAPTTVASLLLAAAVVAGYGIVAADHTVLPAIVAEAPVPPSFERYAADRYGPPNVPAAEPDATSAVAAEASPLALLVSADSESASAPLAATATSRVTLVGHATSWIQLRSLDGRFVRARALGAGERLGVPARSDLALSAGDGGAVEILVDGQSAGFAGAPGAVVRDLALAAEVLVASRTASR
jgi:cytoskeleton protein RodZ